MILAPSAPPLPPPTTHLRHRRLFAAHFSSSLPLLSSSSSSIGQKPKQVLSVSNPLVKHCVKLRMSASYRRNCRRLLVVGLKPILEICRFQKMKDHEFPVLDNLLLLDGIELPDELCEYSSLVAHVSPVVMKKVSGMQSVDSTEASAVIRMPKSFCDLESTEEDDDVLPSLFHSPHRVLVLDGIQDPGNLGTLIRSARAFKWDGVFLLPGCCDPFNEKALRAARGASFQLTVVSGNWSHLKAFRNIFSMRMLAGHPKDTTDGSNKSLSLSQELVDTLIDERLCLVLGSEGNGISNETLEICELVSIPMEGTFESLNVSVAGGIFLFML